MSDQPTESSVPLAEISHGPSAFEAFLENNQKLIILLAILIVLGTAAYVVMRGVEKSRQETAGSALAQADGTADLKKLIDEHAGTQAAKSAEILLADQQWQEGEQDAAITTLEDFLSNHPKHPAAPTAKASLAAKWLEQGKTTEAVDAFQEIIDNPNARYIAPFALISLGDIAKAGNDTSKAEESYQRVQAEYPESFFVNQANQRLANLKAQAPTIVEPEPAPAPKEETTPEITPSPESAPTETKPETTEK